MNKNIKYIIAAMLILTFISTTVYASTIPVQANEKFSDVGIYWATDSITWALSKDLVAGYPDGTFGPARSLSEAEFAVMLSRFSSNIDVNKLETAKEWTDPYYSAVKEFTLPFKGYNDVSIRHKPVDRGTIAQIIASKNGFDLPLALAIEFMYQNDLSQGTDTSKKTFDTYGTKLPLQRDQAVTFFQRLDSVGVTTFFGIQSPVDGKTIITEKQKQEITNQIKPKVSEWLKEQGNKVSAENKKDIENWLSGEFKPVSGELSAQAKAEFDKLPTFPDMNIGIRAPGGKIFNKQEAVEFARQYLQVRINYDGTDLKAMDKWEQDLIALSGTNSKTPILKQKAIDLKAKSSGIVLVDINKINVDKRFYVYAITEGMSDIGPYINKVVLEVGTHPNDPNKLVMGSEKWN